MKKKSTNISKKISAQQSKNNKPKILSPVKVDNITRSIAKAAVKALHKSQNKK